MDRSKKIYIYFQKRKKKKVLFWYLGHNSGCCYTNVSDDALLSSSVCCFWTQLLNWILFKLFFQSNLQDKPSVYLHKMSNYLLFKDSSEKDATQKFGRDCTAKTKNEGGSGGLFKNENQLILIKVMMWRIFILIRIIMGKKAVNAATE